ncbi:MAG: hypothetical protein L0Z62_36965 [Gemmataceae bacterium]|nr:hypothetical protein [Gemmataceae bacterium]
MEIATLLLAAAHALGGAAWFGAMVYSLTVLQPRAARYFERPERFEEFITFVSAGARWKVLGAFALVGGSGPGLLFVARPVPSAVWLTLIGVKGALFLAALALFVHVSWRLWPARVLALPEEIPSLQRTFRRAGWAMIALVGLSLVLGVISHRL